MSGKKVLKRRAEKKLHPQPRVDSTVPNAVSLWPYGGVATHPTAAQLLVSGGLRPSLVPDICEVNALGRSVKLAEP